MRKRAAKPLTRKEVFTRLRFAKDAADDYIPAS